MNPLSKLTDLIYWHQHRDWCSDFATPRGVVNPCGDCGRPGADHPIPRVLNIDSERVARLILTLADERPAR